MNMIWTAALAWIGWNIVGPLAAVVAIFAVVALCSLPGVIRRATCKHLNFFENRSCDAICRDCGKNLGFIDNARARRAKLERLKNGNC